MKCIHIKYSGVKGSLAKIIPLSVICAIQTRLLQNADSLMNINRAEDIIEKVELFCYFEEVLHAEGGSSSSDFKNKSWMEEIEGFCKCVVQESFYRKIEGICI